MFKVSLLPDSYRRHLQSRDKIDIVSKIALVILVCLFIVYAGFAIKDSILEKKLREVQRKNQKLENKVPELREYQAIYNDLVNTKNMTESIKSRNVVAPDFVALLLKNKPDYVKFEQIDLTDWFGSANCTVACTVQDYQDMLDYKDLLENGDMNQFVKQVELLDVTRQGNSLADKAVKFTLVLSVSGTITVQPQDVQPEQVTPEEPEQPAQEEAQTQPTTDVPEDTSEETSQPEQTTSAQPDGESTTADELTTVEGTTESEG